MSPIRKDRVCSMVIANAKPCPVAGHGFFLANGV
jgi:hypothetical protein